MALYKSGVGMFGKYFQIVAYFFCVHILAIENTLIKRGHDGTMFEDHRFNLLQDDYI